MEEIPKDQADHVLIDHPVERHSVGHHHQITHQLQAGPTGGGLTKIPVIIKPTPRRRASCLYPHLNKLWIGLAVDYLSGAM